MSGVGEAAAAVGITTGVIHVGKFINKKVNPSKILKYGEQMVNNFDNEKMMTQLIKRDPAAAKKVQILRRRAEKSLDDAAKKIQNTGFWAIRVRLEKVQAAIVDCQEYTAELKDLSAAAQRKYNDKLLDGPGPRNRSAAAMRQFNARLPDVGRRKSSNPTACATAEFSDPKSNSQSLFTYQIPPSSSSAKLITSMDERGEVSNGPGGLLSIQVKEEMIESVLRGQVRLAADLLRQNDDNESLNIVPSPNAISIQSSNTLTVDPDLIMGEIFAMMAG